MFASKRVAAIILARNGSTRLPRKMLLPFGESTVVETTIDRIRKSTLIDEFIFATSISSSDDSLAALAEKAQLKCYRGSENDVVDRMWTAVHRLDESPDIIVRVCCDNPLVMPGVVDDAIRTLIKKRADVITPGEFHTYPFGFSMVAMTGECLEKIHQQAKDPTYREHVENFCFEHPAEFRILYQKAPDDLFYPDLELTLDYEVDYQRMLNLEKKLRDVDIADQPRFLINLLRRSRIGMVYTDESTMEIARRLHAGLPGELTTWSADSDWERKVEAAAFDILILDVPEPSRFDTSSIGRGVFAVKRMDMADGARNGLFDVGRKKFVFIDYQSNVENESPQKFLERILPIIFKKLLNSPLRPASAQEGYFPSAEKKGTGDRLGFAHPGAVCFPPNIFIDVTDSEGQMSSSHFQEIFRELEMFPFREVSIIGHDGVPKSKSWLRNESHGAAVLEKTSFVTMSRDRIVADCKDIASLFCTIFIAPDGTIHAPYRIDMVLGRVGEDSISAIWQGKDLLSMRIEALNSYQGQERQ